MTSNAVRNAIRELTRTTTALERSGLGAGTTTIAGPNGQRMQLLDDSTTDTTGDDGLDEAGFTLFCATRATDGYGSTVVTDVKIRKKWGRLFYCEPVDECCSPAWWCISNSWVETAASCCPSAPGVSITRIIKVVFSAVSGATLKELGLPVTAYFVNESGSLLWSGASSSGILWDLGLNQVTGGIEWFCDGATLKAQVTLSNFTGGTAATSSCTVTDVPVNLGNYNVTRTVTKICPVSGAMYTEEVTGVVGVTVASYIDGLGDPITGVVNYGEFVLPPWDANGPWKTEEEAINCCGEFIDAASLGLDGTTDCERVCTFNVRRYVKTVVRQVGTGHIVAMSPRLDLLDAWKELPALTLPLCRGYFLAGNVSGTIPTCPANPTDIFAQYGGFRQIIGADTFSTPTVEVGSIGTRFLTISAITAEPGWTVSGPGTGGITASRSVCGLTDFLRLPTKVATYTNTPATPDGTCAAIDLELWIEPA